eukprot:5329291-Prymnesium_polylepis.2
MGGAPSFLRTGSSSAPIHNTTSEEDPYERSPRASGRGVAMVAIATLASTAAAADPARPSIGLASA